jgi:hypothetical protein
MQLTILTTTTKLLAAFTILASIALALPAYTELIPGAQISILEENHWHCTVCALWMGGDKCLNLTAGETESVSAHGTDCTVHCKEELKDAHDCEITEFNAKPGGGCFCGACNWEKSCPYK